MRRFMPVRVAGSFSFSPHWQRTAANATRTDDYGPDTAVASTTPPTIADEKVLVLDFGSQYAQLIARRVREQHVYCEIVRHDITAERDPRDWPPRGIILSGGPASVYEPGAPKCDPEIFRLGMPVLGICYGMQLACEALGGQVQSAPAREYGRAALPHHRGATTCSPACPARSKSG